MRKKASFREISIECAKHALEYLSYISTFQNLSPDQLCELGKFIFYMNGYYKALKNYKEQSDEI